ncbi:hypothetical protein FGADI_654 [Fusarium gaditjirri]|uniref:Uncharacterized protein n=1 Tax=Fusarium gaditjirri TaxID=282569 RepID=A0A8H4TMV2_9HYPO|nr:hypothetical protein FGADI_654 [Fusarium gaditjirri]
MGHSRKIAMSLFTCALLIPSLFTPHATAFSLRHHARLNRTDLEIGNEGLKAKSTGYMAERIHNPEALAPRETSSDSTQGDTPRKHSDGHDFDLIDLRTLFPEGHIPSNTSDLQYGLITFGAGSEPGAVDPVSSGSGFLLAVGETHGLAQLQKRDGRPDPFVFLDCPANVFDQPINQTQKARVVCTSEDVDGCFRVMERGVEGTLVEMPEECAPNSFARAISLELAEDQTMPDHLVKRHTPTSPIYEFSFDFNKQERRADAKVAIRMDMTNIKEHWEGLGKSPGLEKRDIESKYISSLKLDWKKTLQKRDYFHHSTGEYGLKIEKDLSTPVFWQAADHCPVGDKNYGEGIAAFIKGKVDASLHYGMTVYATSTKGSSRFDVKTAFGFIKVTGQTDLTFGVGGMGHLDISMAGKGNPAKSEEFYEVFQRHTINAGSLWGYMSLLPFTTRQTFLATSHMDEPPSTASNRSAPATLNGRLTTRVKTDLGDFPAAFPHILFPDEMHSLRKDHKETEMDVSNDDILYGDGGEKGSTIQIGHNLVFGLSLEFGILPDLRSQQPTRGSSAAFFLVTSETYASWDIPPAKDDKVYPHATASSLLKQGVVGKKLLGWKNGDGSALLFVDKEAPYYEPYYSTKSKQASMDYGSPGNQSAAISTNNVNKTGFHNPEDTFGSVRLRPMDIFSHVAYFFTPQSLNRNHGNISCDNGRCGSCLV